MNDKTKEEVNEFSGYTCRTCRGKGTVTYTEDIMGVAVPKEQICPSCQGKGVRKDPNRDHLD
jgi:DnaJ-class molecular chaperone